MANNNQIYKMSNAGGFKSLTRYYDMLAGNTAWNPWSPVGAYDALATITVPSGGVASVVFNGIPTGYKHLQIRGTVEYAAGTNAVFAFANADTSTNYSWHQVYGTGFVTGSNGESTTANANISVIPASGTASTFITDILDYSSTSKYKTYRSLTGYESNVSGVLSLRSTLWRNTAAITSLTLKFDTAVNLPQYSQFALYGVK